MKILETILYAEDLHAAHTFYTSVLGLEVISFDPERSLFLRLDGTVLIIFKPSRTIIHDSIVPPHGAVGIGHAAFAATREELESWRAKLGDAVTKEITWQNGARSIYFDDPAGNVLEFATRDLWFQTDSSDVS
ncbi:MAG TPA: VOC family protein [Fimbriimonas sp.]|nr:VOC family protein [Fimbriimonas sp.]